MSFVVDRPPEQNLRLLMSAVCCWTGRDRWYNFSAENILQVFSECWDHHYSSHLNIRTFFTSAVEYNQSIRSTSAWQQLAVQEPKSPYPYEVPHKPSNEHLNAAQHLANKNL